MPGVADEKKTMERRLCQKGYNLTKFNSWKNEVIPIIKYKIDADKLCYGATI